MYLFTDSSTTAIAPSSISKLNGIFKEGIVQPLAAFIYVYLSPLKTGQRKFIPPGKPG
jgi:hypothetical protein